MKKNKQIIEKGIIAGNVYNKNISKNIIVQSIMKRFYDSLWNLISMTNANEIHEVGCGEGYLTFLLAQSGKKVKASDFSSQIIDKANKYISKMEKKLNINFKVGSIYDLKPPIDSAELVICSEVLEHLEYPEQALSKLTELAKPYLLISVPREPLWRIANMMRLKYLYDFGNTPGHIQHWSKKKFLKLISNNGIEVLKVLTPFLWIMVLCRQQS